MGCSPFVYWHFLVQFQTKNTPNPVSLYQNLLTHRNKMQWLAIYLLKIGFTICTFHHCPEHTLHTQCMLLVKRILWFYANGLFMAKTVTWPFCPSTCTHSPRTCKRNKQLYSCVSVECTNPHSFWLRTLVHRIHSTKSHDVSNMLAFSGVAQDD